MYIHLFHYGHNSRTTSVACLALGQELGCLYLQCVILALLDGKSLKHGCSHFPSCPEVRMYDSPVQCPQLTNYGFEELSDEDNGA